jgi:multimeric flavodoxin WrbA
MKIVAINGSHRGEKGYTHFLLEKFFKGCVASGADCEEIILAKHQINLCKACEACATEKHYLKCIYEEKDDVSHIFEKMRCADTLIYATPIYIMTMTGLMKIFLDRIYSTGDCSKLRLSKCGLFFHHVTEEIYSKPFVTLVCQDNMENETSKNVVSYFKTYSRFMDAPQVGTIVRRSGGVTGHGKSPEKEQLYPKILESYQAIERAGSELVRFGRISKKTQKIASQDVIPVPFFSILKNFKWFKRKALEKIAVS